MGHGAVKVDPAIERFNRMREDAYINFRWTKRTVRTAMLGFIIVPSAIFYVASTYQLKWDWRAKRKGESLASAPQADSE